MRPDVAIVHLRIPRRLARSFLSPDSSQRSIVSCESWWWIDITLLYSYYRYLHNLSSKHALSNGNPLGGSCPRTSESSSASSAHNFYVDPTTERAEFCPLLSLSLVNPLSRCRFSTLSPFLATTTITAMRPTSSSPSTNQGCFTVRMVTVLATLLSMASSVQANNVVYSFANQASAKRNSITNAVVTCKFSNSETSTYTQNCVEGQELTITADMYWYNTLPAPTTGSDGSTTYKMQMKMCEYGGNQCNTIEFDDDLCAGGYEVTLTPAVYVDQMRVFKYS